MFSFSPLFSFKRSPSHPSSSPPSPLNCNFIPHLSSNSSSPQGGVLLLLFGICLTLVQRKVGRKLSVDLGGHKRLQAVSTLVVAVLLMPWALYQFLTLDVSKERSVWEEEREGGG
jgi:hypothetical protein